MEKRSTALSLSLITGAALIIGGAWYIINDLLGDHQGLLFEGVVAWSLGLLLTSIVVIGDRIRQAHDKFADVFDRQAEIQQYLTQKFNEERIQKNNLANMLRNNAEGAQKPGDMNDPKQMIQSINDAFKFYSTWDGNFWTMTQDNHPTLDELEQELSKAVNNENFEKAEKIRQQIAFLKGLDEPENTGDETPDDNPDDNPE